MNELEVCEACGGAEARSENLELCAVCAQKFLGVRDAYRKPLYQYVKQLREEAKKE